MKIVLIKWIDTLSKDGWYDKNDIKEWLEDDGGIITDVGFLVAETTDWVCISPSYSEITEQHDYLKKIPKEVIGEMKIIKTLK
jgi:hypothetical protein